jgi:flavin-dependent dehydrogenase
LIGGEGAPTLKPMGGAPYIVIGGGLAGAAFALELARNGRPALLLESSREPHHKVCGEFLSAEAQALLVYLGLDVAAMGAPAASRFRLAHKNKCAEAPLPFCGAGFSRYRLDQSLLQAAEAAGVEIRRGVTVTRVAEHQGRVKVKAGSHQFDGSGAALATGKHNLRQYPRAPSDMVGFKFQLRLTKSASRSLEGIVQLAMFDGGYIGACIVEDSLVTVCWVMHRALLQRIGADWPSQAAHVAQQCEIMRELLEGAQPQWEKPIAIAGIPYGYLRRTPISPAIFPLGDQLAVIPSFTGDGMSIALYSGIAAAQTVLAGEDAVHFQERTLVRLRPQLRWAGLTNLLFEKSALHGFSVGLAQTAPRLVTWIAQSTRIHGFEEILEGAPVRRAV